MIFKIDPIFDEYLEYFHAFLDSKKLNVTQERNMILRSVYEMETLFTKELLKEYLRKKNRCVSISTLYSTLELFLESGLLKKDRIASKKKEQQYKINELSFLLKKTDK